MSDRQTNRTSAYVQVLDEDRRRHMFEVFETDTMRVVAPVVRLIQVPDLTAPQWAYMIDLTALGDARLGRLIDHLAARFGRRRELVAHEVQRDGCPLLEPGTRLLVDGKPSEPHRFDPRADVIPWRLLS